MPAISLTDRAILAIGGDDARSFLQSLLTCNVDQVTEQHATYGALLSAQGKFQYDFFLFEHAGQLMFDLQAESLEAFSKVLAMYKLRAAVTMEAKPEMMSVALPGGEALALFDMPEERGAVRMTDDVCVMVDPRHTGIGVRLIGERGYVEGMLERMALEVAPLEHYHRHRLSLGIPEGTHDAVVGRTILLENGYDQLGAVDFTKGCYIGQEVTARSKHRGQLRKYLYQVEADEPLPEPGTDVLAADGRVIGSMRSSVGTIGMALIRDDMLMDNTDGITTGGVAIRLQTPWWREAA